MKAAVKKSEKPTYPTTVAALVKKGRAWRGANPAIIQITTHYGRVVTGILVELSRGYDGGSLGIVRTLRMMSVDGYVPRAVEIFVADAAPVKLVRYVSPASPLMKWLSLAQKYHSTVGCDPEFFIRGRGGTLIPAHERLPAKGRQPGVFWDGFQGEFTVPAESCLDLLRSNITEALLTTSRHLKAGEYLSMDNVVEPPPEWLEKAPPEYVNFGCAPSRNVYDDVPPIQGLDPRSVPIRTAGGHIHLSLPAGFLDKTDKAASLFVLAVKELDRVLGVISIGLFQHWERPERRILYGRAGEFRKTKYGMEYRTLSNAWLVHPVAYNLVYEIARRVIGYVYHYEKPLAIWKVTEKQARQIIDDVDIQLAKKVFARNEEALWSLLASIIYDVADGDIFAEESSVDILKKAAMNMVVNGIHTDGVVGLKHLDRIDVEQWNPDYYPGRTRRIREWASLTVENAKKRSK